MKEFVSFSMLLASQLLLNFKIAAQSVPEDSVRFDYDKIYSYCLNADVSPVLSLIAWDQKRKIAARDLEFKRKFEDRFKLQTDSIISFHNEGSGTEKLLNIFQHYWRISLLDTSKVYAPELEHDLTAFLVGQFPGLKPETINDDSMSLYLNRFIESNRLHTTAAIGKTGRLYDLLIWRTEKDSMYTFLVGNERISARVVMMGDFITLGWEEYATLGRYFPGGWTTEQSLYCVENAYDLNSEDFQISYLAHESRHFKDLKLFPGLSGDTLEYRAKLTELSLAKQTIYSLIDLFIKNAWQKSGNAHSMADYQVIHHLSVMFFHTAFEKNIAKWKTQNILKINHAAQKLLRKNTKELFHKRGR